MCSRVFDSCFSRMIRETGSQSDSIRVPFALLASSRNECQFNMTAHSVVMPQRLRGTVSYMITSSDSDVTDQHIINFKLHIPCTSYLVATPLSRLI